MDPLTFSQSLTIRDLIYQEKTLATGVMDGMRISWMENEEQLLKEILARPNDDAPRLNYAMNLLKVGTPETVARGEFIKVQLELESASLTVPLWAKLLETERQHYQKYHNEWERPLRDSMKAALHEPARWLRNKLFGVGGIWTFRRGFIEGVQAPAEKFLVEDVQLFGKTPLRRIVLTHASNLIPALLTIEALNDLESLHLVGDMELDEELDTLIAHARASSLEVLEFRYPRLGADADDLFNLLRRQHPVPEQNDFPLWSAADEEARSRIRLICDHPRLAQRVLEPDPLHEPELLALNDWIYLGNRLKNQGIWAIAKSHQDLEDENHTGRRLFLVRSGNAEELKQSPYFVKEITEV